MRVTAIIALTLIGLLFLLKECGNSELEKATREGSFPEYQPVVTKDKSYQDRDQEIALASYDKKAVQKEVARLSAREAVKVPQPTTQIPEPITPPNPVKANHTLPAISTPIEVSNVAEPVKALDVPIEPVVEKPAQIDEDEARLVLSKAVSESIETVTIDMEKAELERELEEKSRTEQLAQREIDELRNKRDALEKELHAILVEQEKLYEKYSAQQEQSERALADINANLTAEIEKQIELKEKNEQLQSEIAKMLAIAEEATEKATLEQEKKRQAFDTLNEKYLAQTESIKELEALISEYQNREANLTAEIKKQKSTHIDLKSEVAKLIAMGKEITDKATLEQREKNQQIQALVHQTTELEENHSIEMRQGSSLREENSHLKSEIEKMLANAKERTEQATQEQEAHAQQLEALQAKLNHTEANLTTKTEQNRELESKVAKLLNMGKEMADKATLVQQTKNEEIEVLRLKTKSLEANLSSERAKQDALQKRNTQLQSEIEKMLAIAKEGTEKATQEQETKSKEFASLQIKLKDLEANLTTGIETHQQLEAKNRELESEIAKLMVEKDELSQRAEIQQNSAKELEILSTEYKSLEANLTRQSDTQKQLQEQNKALQTKIDQLNQTIQAKAEAEAQAKAKEEAKKELTSTFSLTQVAFKNNSMELTDESKALLNRAAEAIKTHSEFHYTIQGHTDNTGNQAYNIQLSKDRADAVKNYLVLQGVNETILSTEGFGPSQPIADNSTEEGRLKNRRVVFEIIDPSVQ